MLRLSTKEALKHFAIKDKHTLYRWKDEGIIQSERAGNRWVWLVPDDTPETATSKELQITVKQTESEKMIEVNKLAAIEAKQKRLIIEGNLQKPEELAEREHQIIEQEAGLAAWRDELEQQKTKQDTEDERLNTLEMELDARKGELVKLQKQLTKAQKKIDKDREITEAGKKALQDAIEAAQAVIEESKARAGEINRANKRAKDMMELIEKLIPQVQKFINPPSKNEKRTAYDFIMRWYQEAVKISGEKQPEEEGIVNAEYKATATEQTA